MILVIESDSWKKLSYLHKQTANCMTTGKALLGVLAGIAAGAVIGVLFAPGKGSDTRKTIVKKSEDLAGALNDKIDEKFSELMGTVTGKIKKVKTNDSVTAHSEMVG